MVSKAEKPNQQETKIPVFAVLKKGITTKNIVLNAPVSGDPSEGELILVGRHQDCQIVLDHPSISRFHLEVKVYPALQQLTITDRSSVHGSWVSGIKIPPKTPIGLTEGDTVRLGASTREYRLQWLSMNEVVEMERPLEALVEGEETHQEEEARQQAANPIPSAPPMPESMDLSSIPEPLVEMENQMEFRLESSDLSVDSVQQFKSPERAVVGYGRTRRSPSPARSEKRVMSSSLLSRRSKSISHLRIQAEEKEDCGLEAASGLQKENAKNSESGMEETLCRVLFDSVDIEEAEEETFDSDKENITPCSSKSLKFKKSCAELRFSLMDACSSLNVEEEVPISANGIKLERGEAYKENQVANTSSGQKSRKSILGVQRSSSNSAAAERRKENVLQSYNQNSAHEACLDKENAAPSPSSGQKSRKSILGLQRPSSDSAVASSKIDRELDDEFPFDDKENLTPIASSGPLKPNKIFSKSQDRIEKQMMRKRVERVPFQSLLENCSPNKSILDNSAKKTTKREENATQSSTESPETKARGANPIALQNKSTSKNSAKKATKREANAAPLFKESPETKAEGAMKHHDISSLHHNIIRSLSESSSNTTSNKAGEEKKTWNMVVDASCFVDEESRRSLQLLQGLRGTHLIIPRIVIREIDCLKRHESLFRKGSYASSMLQWIERCMVSSSWWIHVQSSLEMAPVAATPPASPRGGFGAAVMPFFTCGSLMEIVSPTSEDHILDCALMFRKLKNSERFVLLSNSVPLKIKAMAEGVLCETPTEFRESLVNPYSKRFLWASSSPRGSTWSCSVEAAALNENYIYQPPLRMTGEGAKGLKLLLLHNYQNRKINSEK